MIGTGACGWIEWAWLYTLLMSVVSVSGLADTLTVEAREFLEAIMTPEVKRRVGPQRRQGHC